MPRFHEHLYQLVLREKPEIAVETGYSGGLSAMHILAAMDINASGKLYSIESFTNQDIFHPRLEFVRGLSVNMMAGIYTRAGFWDLFLHDSDHEVGCTTFEYELSWSLLKPGGILISDDFEWGDPPHHSWKDFLNNHDCLDITTIGSAQYCRKPKSSQMPTEKSWLDKAVVNASEQANIACRKRGLTDYYKI